MRRQYGFWRDARTANGMSKAYTSILQVVHCHADWKHMATLGLVPLLTHVSIHYQAMCAAVGGLMGYKKKKSKDSLIASSIIAGLLLVSAYLMGRPSTTYGVRLALGIPCSCSSSPPSELLYCFDQNLHGCAQTIQSVFTQCTCHGGRCTLGGSRRWIKCTFACILQLVLANLFTSWLTQQAQCFGHACCHASLPLQSCALIMHVRACSHDRLTGSIHGQGLLGQAKSLSPGGTGSPVNSFDPGIHWGPVTWLLHFHCYSLILPRCTANVQSAAAGDSKNAVRSCHFELTAVFCVPMWVMSYAVNTVRQHGGGV